MAGPELSASPRERIYYCPSCGAQVEAASMDLKCEVCGTEFRQSDEKSAEQLIARSDTGTSRKSRISTEDALLDRLKQEAPPKKPIGWQSMALIAIAIAAVSYLIVHIASKPDKFAVQPGADSSELFQKRLQVQTTIDSLEKIVNANPSDATAHVTLADAYYDGQYWTKSIHEFQSYLKLKPDDAGARVDYAYALGQQPDGITVALEEIDTALKYKPDYLPGLYNGGILSIQQTKGVGHTEALARAREYFRRAKIVADTAAPFMAKQIDTLLIEIDKTGSVPAK